MKFANMANNFANPGIMLKMLMLVPGFRKSETCHMAMRQAFSQLYVFRDM
jgi:hypothetical protein